MDGKHKIVNLYISTFIKHIIDYRTCTLIDNVEPFDLKSREVET